MGMNRIEQGSSIMIAIPAGGCSSGGQVASNSTTATPGVPVLVGNDMVGIPEGTYASGTTGNVTVLLRGVYNNIAKLTTDTFNVGDKLYLDNGNGWLTTNANGGANVWVGWAWNTGANGDTACSVKLRG